MSKKRAKGLGVLTDEECERVGAARFEIGVWLDVVRTLQCAGMLPPGAELKLQKPDGQSHGYVAVPLAGKAA